MRRNLWNMVAAACAVALLGSVAVQFASSATTTRTRSIPARVTTLESKVRALTASVKTLKTDVATLKTRADCLGAQGISQFGNPAAGQGYIYTNDGGYTAWLTTAFDAPASGQTPTFYAATVNPACVTSESFRLHGGIAAHTRAALPTP
jgi:hypothetical protein